MTLPTISSTHLRLTLGESADGTFVDQVELRTPRGWETIVCGCAGGEFATSVGNANAATCVTNKRELRLSAKTGAWEADAVITLDADSPILRRTQTYRFLKSCEAAIHPGWRIVADRDVRYTFPLRAHEQPLVGLKPLRADVAWALPLPFHIWHNRQFVALYGVDRTASKGTIDFLPPDRVRVYFPDTAQQDGALPVIPQTTRFRAGEEITITEILAAKPLRDGDVPLLEAARLAAGILLRERRPASNWATIADGIGEFYRRCELWNPDALGPGRGWFVNMWIHTAAGKPAKTGEFSGYYDLGWGEGFGARTIGALTHHWQRTRQADLLPYVDELTRNLECFRRPADPAEAAGFYDRFHPPGLPAIPGHDAQGLADFMGFKNVWSHSLGHVGYQLLRLSAEVSEYPSANTRATWRATAESIARFFAQRQRADGDLPDGFDAEDREANRKPHRIPARAVVCGLWARLGGSDTARALRLARAVAPDIEQFHFHNQMLDTHTPGGDPKCETTDAENAIYALEGLVELYDQTRDADVLRWAKHCAAYTFLWTYFYDLPTGYHGVTRGSTCCRMPDYPLVYLGAAAQAVRPLCRLSELTGDPLHRQMAGEMIDCIARYQWNAPGKPWHGGMVHALDQQSGRHWGPDREGQVDSGMTTATSLIALEYCLAHPPPSPAFSRPRRKA